MTDMIFIDLWCRRAEYTVPARPRRMLSLPICEALDDVVTKNNRRHSSVCVCVYMCTDVMESTCTKNIPRTSFTNSIGFVTPVESTTTSSHHHCKYRSTQIDSFSSQAPREKNSTLLHHNYKYRTTQFATSRVPTH